MTNIKDLWLMLREDPTDKDIVQAFNRACTPMNVHYLLQDITEENDRLERRVKFLETIITNLADNIKEAVKA